MIFLRFYWNLSGANELKRAIPQHRKRRMPRHFQGHVLLEFGSGMLNKALIITWSNGFYPRPFWPTGIVIACVCVCVCVSVCLSTFACPSDNSSHVPPTITWFGQKDAKHFAYGAYCFGGWLNINFQVKFNFISKSCLFASLLRPWNICETCKNGW